MEEVNIDVNLDAMQELKRKVRVHKKLCPLDQLLWVVAVASNKEDEVILCERECSKSQDSGGSSSSAVESLRKLTAMGIISMRRDDDHSHLGKDNLDDFDSRDAHYHDDLSNKRNITSEKDEHAVATEYGRKNDGDDDDDDRDFELDDDDWAFELRKREEKRKGLKRKYYSPPSGRHQDFPEEHRRKQNLAFYKNLFNSMDDDDHSDFGKKKSAFESRRNCGIQIREPLTTYEKDAEAEDFDFQKSKDKGKGLMMYREQKRVTYNSQPSTSHQDLPEDKTLFNSKGNDHGDLAEKKKMVSFNGKVQNSSAFKSRRNYGIQIREPREGSNENDAEDKDWDFDSKKSKNKGKGLMIHREKKRTTHNSPPSTIHRDLPENFKRKIETMGGDSNNAQLVLQKNLYKSDIEKQQNRLSLPMNQLLCAFLNPDEVARLEDTSEFMNITIIDPMGEEEPVCFKKWTYKETVKSYVLITRWRHIALKNNLKPDDLIQVWSFRDRENNLHLAVVRRDESSDGGAAGCSSSSNAANASTSAVSGEGSSGDHGCQGRWYNSGGYS